MRKTTIGLLAGAAAGIIDVAPMVAQHLTWDANLSAFCFWIINGFLIANTNLKLPPVLKGVAIAYLVLIPLAILIGWKEPFTLLPIGCMTLVLGGLLGYVIEKWGR